MGKKQKDPHAVSSRAVRGLRAKAQVDLRTTPRNCQKGGSSKVGQEETGRVTGSSHLPEERAVSPSPWIRRFMLHLLRAQVVKLPEQALCEPNFSIRCGCYPCDTGPKIA